MIEEIEKELLKAMRDLDFKARSLKLFITYFPTPTSLPTYPAVVVETEIKVTKEYYEAHDHFYDTLKKYRAIQTVTKQTF